jgi:prepilin-type processing-associated H-X9-DG protein
MATYTIIGSDQKQYGSVTADDVRRWIAEGRLNEQSVIKAQGDTEFRLLPDFPEFTDALAAKAGAGITPPPLPGAAPAAAGKTSGLAIAALVLSILGIATCGLTLLITAPLALILGLVAMNKIGKSQGQLGGRGLALAGVITSCVSLALLPIFAAMLLPAFAAAKQKAQSINCVNNVKVLSTYVLQQADDNQNHFPAATNWCDVLLQSHTGLTSIFHCPADFSGGRCSYAFNAQLAGAEVGKVNPSTVMIFEAAGGWNTSGGREFMLSKPRHGQFVVVGFADGSVEQVPEARLPELRWDP